MIQRVKVEHFKRFLRSEFVLGDSIVLAGPNNTGKTTLLQAIAVWDLARRKWLERRGASKSKALAGVPITRDEFTAIPLREMKLLWHDTSTNLRKEDKGKPGSPRPMSILIEGTGQGGQWSLAFQFRYQSSELVYARPSDEKTVRSLAQAGEGFQVVHVPPFSGIGAEEPRYDRPYQDLLIGQGKAGDIVRNLLLEVYDKHRKQQDSGWPDLVSEVERIFRYQLMAPEYAGQPFIRCEYLPGVPPGKGRGALPSLDIASAGSGFHQVLLLLGFFHARPSTVLLLDEPDAHLHVILQKQVYDRLRLLASKRRSQMVIATHSEVLLDGTAPSRIMSFYGEPHILQSDVEVDQVREALKRVSAMDMLLAEPSPGVLYVEGESDFNLLRAFSRASGHRLAAWFDDTPFWVNNQGRSPREARAHFFAMRALNKAIRGFLLLDGDNRGLPDRDVAADGLAVGRWKRYEIESYLIHPDSLSRFAEQRGLPLTASTGMNFLRDEVPRAALSRPRGEHDYFQNVPASKTLLPGFLRACQINLQKIDYFQIAEQMLGGEIHPEVVAMLDSIAASFGL